MKSLKYNKLYRKLLTLFNKHFPTLIAKLRYRRTFGENLNLVNPQNINEKILWLSLYSDITLWTRLADKYAVRGYVEEMGLGDILIPLIGKWDSPEEIHWDTLPNSFVMKTNNGSGTNLIVNDKDKLDIDEAKRCIDKWFNNKIATTTTEFHYNDIVPCVIAEELLLNPAEIAPFSSTLIDYKIWCFNGIAYYVWACSNRVGNSTEVALFDRNWNYLPDKSVFTEHYKKQLRLVPKPDNLDGMLKVAETLSKGFPVVRVDLYNLKGKIFFGEMTFTSLGGQMDFYTPQALLEMGRQVDISNIKKVRNI